MPSYSVEAGVWAMAMPPSPLIARIPRVPSLPVPDRTMPMALSRWSRARERKKKSMGRRWPRGVTGSNRARQPPTNAMSRLGGMM